MKCVFCNGELNNFDQVCPYCGKPVQRESSGYSYGGNSIGNHNLSNPNPYSTQTDQQAYGQTAQQTYGQVSQQTYGQVSQPTYGQVSQPTYGQTAQPTYGQTSQPTYGQVSQPIYGQVSQPTYGQTSQPTYGQTSQPTYGQVSQPSYGQTSQPTYGQVSQPSYSQGYEMPEPYRRKSILPIVLVSVGVLVLGGAALSIALVFNVTKEQILEIGETVESAEAAEPENDPAEGYEAVTEDVTWKDLILPGIEFGMTYTEFDDALREKYPQLEFRDDHEETNPETGRIQDYSYYATPGNQQVSIYGVSDTAIYAVGYADDGTLNYARLYFGDVYATDDSEYLMYCKNSNAREQENFGQLKASMDEQFGKGEFYDNDDPEVRECYVYRPSDDTAVMLASRKSKNDDSDTYLYDTVVEYFFLEE